MLVRIKEIADSSKFNFAQAFPMGRRPRSYTSDKDDRFIKILTQTAVINILKAFYELDVSLC